MDTDHLNVSSEHAPIKPHHGRSDTRNENSLKSCSESSSPNKTIQEDDKNSITSEE